MNFGLDLDAYQRYLDGGQHETYQDSETQSDNILNNQSSILMDGDEEYVNDETRDDVSRATQIAQEHQLLQFLREQVHINIPCI